MTAAELPDPGAAWVRPPAVAGTFYPGTRDELQALVESHLTAADAPVPTTAAGEAGEAGAAAIEADRLAGEAGEEAPPEAIVAPHAGLQYSGATAAVAYRAVAPRRAELRRVVVIGPAHRVPVDGPGIGVSTAVAWRTPLGDVPLDTAAAQALVTAGLAVEADAAHAPEHSVEVHLPYVQVALGPVTVVPLVVGSASSADVARVLAALWTPDTLVVASSDLSHYLDEASARARDARTATAVVEERTDDIGPEDACGFLPVRGLLLAARRRGLVPRLLASTTSAAASGDTDRVVGYGAFGLGPPLPLDDEDRRWLTALARRAIEHELGTGDLYPLVDREVPERLRAPRASFVTLERGDELLGCIGSLEPRRPLWQDVARNARAAAFEDPRFGRLTPDELGEARVEISVLSPLVEIPAEHRQDVERVVRPGVDGVLLAAGTHRGTFLPAVWAKLPEPATFVSQLVRKAGLDDDWPEGARAWRYTTDEFAEA